MITRKGRAAAVSATAEFVSAKSGFSDPNIETDPKKIEECIRFLECALHNTVVVLCSRDRVNYVSPNCKDVIGFTHTFFRSLSLDDTIGLIHEEDVDGFKSCIEKVLKTTTTQYDEYKHILYYRMNRPAGGYQVIEDEKIAIETTPGKFVFITLLKNVSDESVFAGTRLIIQRKIKNKFVSIDEFRPARSKQIFSSRQLDIVKLMANGLSNKDIADKLSLSVSTIKNHKQQLFKRANVRSSIALLNYVNRCIFDPNSSRPVQ